MNSACISKLIIPGALISFRIFNQTVWSLNIVSQCSGDTLNIPLTNDLMKACLFTNTNVEIKYRNEYFEYNIKGVISKIELSASPYINVKIDHVAANLNHRVFPRLDVCLPATLTNGNESYYCSTSNLSLGGVAFLMDREIPVNTCCEINILLEDSSSVYAKGEILRMSREDSLYKYSMMFNFMEEENSNRLYSYLLSLEDSYSSLRNKYL